MKDLPTRCTKRTATVDPATENADSTARVKELWERISKAASPAYADIEELRDLLATTPALWQRAYELGRIVRDVVVQKATHGLSQACALAEIERLEQQFGYEAASPLERLLIEHLLTARVRLVHAENAYTEAVSDGNTTLALAFYWEKRLSAAQMRFLRAAESLARIRQLSRATPSLQINIATVGGQQVNVQQGELGLLP